MQIIPNPHREKIQELKFFYSQFNQISFFKNFMIHIVFKFLYFKFLD